MVATRFDGDKAFTHATAPLARFLSPAASMREMITRDPERLLACLEPGGVSAQALRDTCAVLQLTCGAAAER